MEYYVLTWASLILQLIAVCSGCEDPVPAAITEVKETDSPGTVLVTMRETAATASSSWSFNIKHSDGLNHYLKGFLSIEHNTSSHVWQVVLSRPMDLEQIKNESGSILSDFTLQLECTLNLGKPKYERTVVINEISEYKPVIADPLPVFNVSEEANVDTIVARLANYVTDLDVQNNGFPTDIKEFYTTPYLGNEIRSGDRIFGVSTSGNLVLLQLVDYENGDKLFAINVTAQDTGGLSDWSVVKIAVVNANDNLPYFMTSSSGGALEEVTEYTAKLGPSYTGDITSLEPGPIKATDLDNDDISYTFVTGYPKDFRRYVHLDYSSGNVSIIRPFNDTDISHFNIIIEARDGQPNQWTKDSDNFHTTTASLLIFIVSGKNISQFPASPGSGSGSSSSSFDTDALFISVIVLSMLLLILIIVIVVIVCKMIRKRRRDAISHVDRGNSSKERRPSDWSIQMRHIEQDGEKDFIHTLSRNDPNTNQSFSNDVNDDVYVNGIAPYHQPTGNHTHVDNYTNVDNHDRISRGIMPYNEQVIAPQTAAVPSSTLPRHPSTIISTNFGSQTQMDVNDALESLNILTSVKPISDDRHAAPTTGTLKSMKCRQDLNEVGQIILNDGNKYDRENGEKITSFTKDNSRNLRRGSDKPNGSRSTVEGVTVFGKDIDVGVIPFDHNSNINENAIVFH